MGRGNKKAAYNCPVVVPHKRGEACVNGFHIVDHYDNSYILLGLSRVCQLLNHDYHRGFARREGARGHLPLLTLKQGRTIPTGGSQLLTDPHLLAGGYRSHRMIGKATTKAIKTHSKAL